MPRVAFDHLVIGAADLAQGSAWARETLGVEIGPGGSHDQMGTHNRLGRLAAGYLEIIAVDPAAPAPARKRWYDLDNPALAAALSERPRPIAWVLAVSDLDWAVGAAAWDPGPILDVSRGDLRWRITVPENGAPPMGVLPTLIEWPEALRRRAPTDRMADTGLALRRLSLRVADPGAVRDRLASLNAATLLSHVGIELSVEERRDATDAPLEAMFTAARLDARA